MPGGTAGRGSGFPGGDADGRPSGRWMFSSSVRRADPCRGTLCGIVCVWVVSWSRDVPRRRAGMVPGMVVRHNMVVRGGSWELWRTVRAGNTGNRGFHGDRGGTPLHNRLSGTCRGAEPDGTRDAGCGVWDTGRGDGDLAPHAPATSTLETTGPTTEPTSPTATNGIGSRRDHPPALHAPSRQREEDTRDGSEHATSRQREEKVPIAL